MGAATDKDTPLKERVARLLLSQGFACRFNVDVVSFSAPSGKNQVTDLDVLGVRFDELLRAERLVVDCKSGNNTSTKERMFWLHGVRTRYGARRAIFVRQQGDPAAYANDYRQLDLSMLSHETLETHEKMNDILPLSALAPYPVGVAADHEAAVATLKTSAKPVHRYLTGGYWNDSLGAQIDDLVAVVLPGLAKPEHAMARGLALGLLAQSVVALVGEVMQTPPGKWPEATRLATSGALTLQSQERLLETFYDFMAQELKEKTGRKWDVPKSTFVRGLDRPYLAELVELVQRLVRNPATRFLPQIVDIAAYACYSYKAPAPLESYVWLKPWTEAAHRALSDFLVFSERIAKLPSRTKDELLAAVRTMATA